MRSNTIENKIVSKIKKCGRGNFFFASDFVPYGERTSVNKALERLTEKGFLLHIAHGVYYYPHKDKILGMGFLQPTLEDIAEGIAKRDRARVAPTGLYALNRLGFSTQVPMNVQFLTDGYKRRLTLYSGATLQFKHTSPKNLAFNSRLAMLLTFAYKSLGKEQITPEILQKTKELLEKDENKIVQQDYKLMPAWVSSIIKSLYEE